MYLQQLYRHNKTLCVLLVLLGAAQIINNLRQDVAISPIYVYGMYSEKMQPKPEYTVPEIFVDDVQLQAKNFTPFQWEKMVQPIILFNKQEIWNNDLYKNYISRIVYTKNKHLYVNNISQKQFDDWYKSYLENNLHKKIKGISVKFSTYLFNGKELVPSVKPLQ